MARRKLTQRRLDIVLWILDYQRRKGVPPSRMEIATRFGVALSAVQGHLESLRFIGVVDWELNQHRALKVNVERLEELANQEGLV